MVRRRIAKLLRARLREYPAVALVGPRQSGKTTLARTMGGAYFDLEQEPERLRLDLDWDRLTQGRDLVVLDEAQAWPEVFTRLRGATDRDRKRRGRFLLLGSVSPSLMTHVSESLAGRLSVLELTPFLATEVARTAARDALWLCGGFPEGGVLKRRRYPQWQRDYLALLAQRDLPNWGLTAGPQVTERMLRMVAAVHGQTWNASQIGQSLGLSYHTVNVYLDYLVGAFLVRRLPPCLPNVRKRLVRSPKVYWRDTGLLHALMNVADEAALLAQPWVGASWEGFVIEQALGVLGCAGRPFEAYYLRTSDQLEVDLVLDLGGDVWAVEVKLTSYPGPADMDRLDRAAGLVGASRRYLVSKAARTAGDERRAACTLPWLLKRLGDRS
jgi:predicted AAA+ superfamily ATPase